MVESFVYEKDKDYWNDPKVLEEVQQKLGYHMAPGNWLTKKPEIVIAYCLLKLREAILQKSDR